MKNIKLPLHLPNFLRQSLFVILIAACATPWVSAPLALATGFLFTLFFGHPFPKLNAKATSLLLKVSVVGLGFGMNLHSAMQVGKEGLLLTICSITLVLTLGYFVGKRLGLVRKLSYLVSSGTAICGGSAIAAVAPAVKANEKEVSVSLGVVFLLNSISLFIFPVLGHLFNMSQHEFGVWCAVAIHDTSSVVGASSAYGNEALEVATAVKLARALWIIPIAFFSAFLFKSKGKKISIPWFIFLFIGAMALNSYCPWVSYFNTEVVKIAKSALVVTLFLIGAGLSVDALKTVGWKPLILGIVLWFCVSIFAFVYIMF